MDNARVAVVTGGSAGIGEATARELTRRGWRCILLARNAERLERVAKELGAEEWQLCDVSDRAQVEAVAAQILEWHPAIGLLVNNAGIPGRGSFVDVEPGVITNVIEVNYLGSVWCLRSFLPGLRQAAS